MLNNQMVHKFVQTYGETQSNSLSWFLSVIICLILYSYSSIELGYIAIWWISHCANPKNNGQTYNCKYIFVMVDS